ncbi:hypothetical protein ABZP36_028398 [Zizania latifolia]
MSGILYPPNAPPSPADLSPSSQTDAPARALVSGRFRGSAPPRVLWRDGKREGRQGRGMLLPGARGKPRACSRRLRQRRPVLDAAALEGRPTWLSREDTSCHMQRWRGIGLHYAAKNPFTIGDKEDEDEMMVYDEAGGNC